MAAARRVFSPVMAFGTPRSSRDIRNGLWSLPRLRRFDPETPDQRSPAALWSLFVPDRKPLCFGEFEGDAFALTIALVFGASVGMIGVGDGVHLPGCTSLRMFGEPALDDDVFVSFFHTSSQAAAGGSGTQTVAGAFSQRWFCGPAVWSLRAPRARRHAHSHIHPSRASRWCLDPVRRCAPCMRASMEGIGRK